MVQLFLHEDTHHSTSKMDVKGTTWLTIMLLVVMYAFQLVGQDPIKWQIVAVCFLIALIATVMFIRTERMAEDPLIPMELFDNRTFVVQNIVVFLVSGFLRNCLRSLKAPQ